MTADTTCHFQESIAANGCRELRKGSISSSCLAGHPFEPMNAALFSFLDRLTADHAAIRKTVRSAVIAVTTLS
jgi:hypothetical protein